MRKIFTHMWIVIAAAFITYFIIDIIKEFGLMSLISNATPFVIIGFAATSFIFWLKDRDDEIDNGIGGYQPRGDSISDNKEE